MSPPHRSCHKRLFLFSCEYHIVELLINPPRQLFASASLSGFFLFIFKNHQFKIHFSFSLRLQLFPASASRREIVFMKRFFLLHSVTCIHEKSFRCSMSKSVFDFLLLLLNTRFQFEELRLLLMQSQCISSKTDHCN